VTDDSQKKDLTNIFEAPLEVDESLKPEAQSLPQEDAFQTLDEFVALSPAPDLASSATDPGAFMGTATGIPPEVSIPDGEPSLAPPAALEAEPLAAIKTFSERALPGAPPVTPALPYSVRIEGALRDFERGKLLALLAQENMGIREVDLEHQLDAGSILIPRVSEFAAVLIVQALKDAPVEMHMGPSDEIYATADTQADHSDPLPRSEAPNQLLALSESIVQGAQDIRIYTGQALPEGHPTPEVIDTLLASALIETTALETEASKDYLNALEALKKELRLRAFRKGARALIQFSIQLTPLTDPRHYRVTAVGLAVK
jgi:hypothetical protein